MTPDACALVVGRRRRRRRRRARTTTTTTSSGVLFCGGTKSWTKRLALIAIVFSSGRGGGRGSILASARVSSRAAPPGEGLRHQQGSSHHKIQTGWTRRGLDGTHHSGRPEDDTERHHKLPTEPSPTAPWTRQLVETLPQVRVRIDPLTHLKLRKTFRWLSTVLSVGADYSTQRGVWTVKYSWEDSLIGGKLQMKGTELQLHKNWIFAIGGAGNLAANLRFKGAFDVATGKMSARFGFRTEKNGGGVNIVDGVDLVKKVPLDGSDGHAKLEVKVKVAFPQPDIQVDKKGDKDPSDLENEVYIGMGDLEIDVDEVNLCLDW